MNQFLSVTGNVYQPDGSPPSFVYCTLRRDSTGTLEDPSSEFRFSLLGYDACAGNARECAAEPLVADLRRRPAAGELLPAAGRSAGERAVRSRDRHHRPDLRSALDRRADFSIAARAPPRPARPADCPVGASCFVADASASCENVRGRVIDLDGFGCGCFVENVPSQCIGCGDGASGQCGGDCDFQVGGFTARGVCLPFDFESTDCSCYAIGASEQQTVQGCGGTLGVACQGNRCCIDDPSDGCDPLGGNAGCSGICVQDDGCTSSGGNDCGLCLAPQGQFCGDRNRDGSEECDGSDLAGESCGSLGFPGGGQLRCSSSCGFDTSLCAQGGNNPPEITSIDFPPIIDPNGGPVDGFVHFEDIDGDITLASFQAVSGNINSFSFDPGVFGRASGEFSFFINCNGNVQDYVLRVTPRGQPGQREPPRNLSFSCRTIAECGNGELEEGEACDPPGASGGCGSGFLCTNDCSDCVSAISCEGRCCPGRDDFCTPPDAQCYCDEACRSFEDCCTDVSAACGF